MSSSQRRRLGQNGVARCLDAYENNPASRRFIDGGGEPLCACRELSNINLDARREPNRALAECVWGSDRWSREAVS